MSEQEPAAGPGDASMADRLGPACIELRGDLEVSRHVFRGKVCYVLLDPLSFTSHRFTCADYAILTRLESNRPLSEIFEELTGTGELEEEDAERFYGFIFSLHKQGLLNLPISDEKSLYDRYKAKRVAKRKQGLKSLMFLRIPLWQPDGFLTRTADRARPFFSHAAFGMWIALLAVAGWVVIQNWAEFSAPVGNIFRNENLPLLWISLIVLKVAHEFGHAYATKLLGGHVPEMGAFLMLLTPSAYVDSTAAWGFSRRRDRLIVNFAGMYVELFLAAVAVLAWSIMPPGLWRSVLHNVVTLASVVTIVFNINPLMRYDGYYALSDYLEIPNLRARAQAEGTRLLKRLALGVIVPGEERPGLRVFLVTFGMASAIYKVTLVLGISATIALKFPAVGIALSVAYILGELWGVLKRSIPYLWGSEETSSVRAWAVSLALLLVAGFPLAIAAIPVPSSVTTVGVLSSETDIIVRTEAAGFLADLPYDHGTVVEAGQILMQLNDREVPTRLEDVEARLIVARIRLDQARCVDPGSELKERTRVEQLIQERDERAKDLAKLTMKSPIAGRIVRGLDQSDLGRFLNRGEPAFYLTAGRTVVRALLSEEEFVAMRPAPGTPVEFRSAANVGRSWKGEVRRVNPAGRREFDQPFTEHLDPADYAVNPSTGQATRSQFELEVVIHQVEEGHGLSHGMTGTLRFIGKSEPLGMTLLRKALTFMRRLTS